MISRPRRLLPGLRVVRRSVAGFLLLTLVACTAMQGADRGPVHAARPRAAFGEPF